MEKDDVIIGLIYLMVEEGNPILTNLLQKSGSFVTNQSSPDEVLDASLKALKDSPSFRQNLSKYLVAESNSYSNYVGDDFFNLGGFDSMITAANTGVSNAKAAAAAKAKTASRKPAKYDPKTGTGGSKVGGILRSVFSQENIGLLVSAGIGAASTKLQDSASSKGNQQAIEFEKAKAETAAREIEAKSGLNTPTPKPKWVLPVAIGGGLLVVGLIVYFATRKK